MKRAVLPTPSPEGHCPKSSALIVLDGLVVNAK